MALRCLNGSEYPQDSGFSTKDHVPGTWCTVCNVAFMQVGTKQHVYPFEPKWKGRHALLMPAGYPLLPFSRYSLSGKDLCSNV